MTVTELTYLLAGPGSVPLALACSFGYSEAMPVDLPRTPWRLTDTGSAFRIEDADGRAMVYVYYRREPALKGEYLDQDTARELAIRIARLSKAAETES